MYTRSRVYARVYGCVYMRVYGCVCMGACVCVRVYACVLNLYHVTDDTIVRTIVQIPNPRSMRNILPEL